MSTAAHNALKKKQGQSYRKEHEEMHEKGHSPMSYKSLRSYEKGLKKKGILKKI